ncbi:uncharacterized protein [Polyergus mexicanus]|uniref:uncharacterized protein n=1 Tax=Polyergus mexicanus TaxID=615972 RepID=UPI0038B441AF
MLQFIVVKFLPTQEDDDLYYEVALAKWIVQIDKNMIGKIFWPKNDAIAGKLVRSEARANETWPQLEVEVKKYYETYIAARNAARGFEEFASAYESDSGCQMGRGMRRKRFMNLVSSDDDSSGSDTKKCKQDKSRSKIPTAPLPPSPPAGLSFLRKSSNIASKENITPLTIVSNKKQSKTAIPPSAAPITAGTRQNKLLHKIINLRHQAADKAQQRKKAMSLENIRKLPVRKKTVYSTLCSESPVKAFETGGSCRSESQSSSLTSSIVSNSQFVEQSSYSSKMSNDIQSPLSQSLYRFLSDKIQNPVTQTQYLSSSFISDYIHRTPPKEFSEFVATEDRSEIDIEPDELSLTSSQTALTSNLTRDLNASLTKLNKKVDNMRAKLDMILINQSKINRILMPEEKILSKPSNMPALPLDTIEQVERFEKFLSNDVQLADTCYYLKSLPLGNDEARAVPKLMSNLMSNSLAQEFNFDGHGDKLTFKSTKLWELVQG